jgi:HAE1 family hydrophobic/amphiphilic exporter-1
MRLAELSVHRPVTVFMGLVSLVVLGAVALTRLPLAFLPTVDAPIIAISVPYPNSSPLQVEREIVKPLEEALSTLSGVRKLTSTANADSAQLNLEFSWGQSISMIRLKVGEKIDQIRKDLPVDVERINIQTFNTAQIPVVEARVSAPGIDLSRNYDLLEERVVNPIRRIPGVARVELNGIAPREVKIDLILDRIKSHRLDIGALVQRLQGANLNVAVGRIVDGTQVLHVRTFGAFEDLEAIANLPVATGARASAAAGTDGSRAAAAGGPGRAAPTGVVRLSDVAEITYEEPKIDFGRHLNRKFAVALAVYKEPTANTVDVAGATTRLIQGEIARDPLLKGVNLFVFQDQAEEIVNGLRGLTEAGMVGGFLAIIVLYLFLRRFDTTFIVSLAIPISIVASCTVLYFLGRNLNVLSMMGLMLGVGLLVDDAIVVLESIFRYHEKTGDARQAAILGTSAVAMAVVAATTTTAIVFLPLIVGEKTELQIWLGEVGIAITLTIFCSLLVSLTLIPLMGSRILSRRAWHNPRWIAWLTDRYESIIRLTLRHRLLTFAATVLVLAGTAGPFLLGLDTAMNTGGRNDRIRVLYDFRDFHFKEDAERVVSRVEDALYARQQAIGFDSVYSYFGENEAQTTITLRRKDMNDREAREFRKTMRAWLPIVPGVQLRFGDEDAEAGGSTTTFTVSLFGDDAKVLERLAVDAAARLAVLPNIQDVKSSTDQGREEVQVSLDRARAARYNLAPRDLAQTFGFMLNGTRLRKYRAGDKEVNVVVRLREEDVRRADDLQGLTLGDARGQTVGTLAGFTMVRRPTAIEREDRKTRVSVGGTYEGKNFSDAQETMRKTMTDMAMPPGFTWSFGQQMEQQDQQNQQMLVNLLLALALIYLVMAALFESIAHPIAILISIPFALFGAVWFDYLTGTPFGLMSQIGLLILMGIVVKNGIVLVDHINQLRREGLTRAEAIVQGGRERMRPILMTAATAILGLVPLAVGDSGIGGAYYYPLARTVIGGLTTSTLLTLVILPYIYTLVDDVAVWLRLVWRHGSASAAASFAAASWGQHANASCAPGDIGSGPNGV